MIAQLQSHKHFAEEILIRICVQRLRHDDEQLSKTPLLRLAVGLHNLHIPSFALLAGLAVTVDGIGNADCGALHKISPYLPRTLCLAHAGEDLLKLFLLLAQMPDHLCHGLFLALVLGFVRRKDFTRLAALVRSDDTQLLQRVHDAGSLGVSDVHAPLQK